MMWSIIVEALRLGDLDQPNSALCATKPLGIPHSSLYGGRLPAEDLAALPEVLPHLS